MQVIKLFTYTTGDDYRLIDTQPFCDVSFLLGISYTDDKTVFPESAQSQYDFAIKTMKELSDSTVAFILTNSDVLNSILNYCADRKIPCEVILVRNSVVTHHELCPKEGYLKNWSFGCMLVDEV